MMDRALMETLFDNCPMHMAILSVPGYRYEMANRAQTEFYESLGVTDFLGREWADVWPSMAHARYLGFLDEVCKTGKPLSVTDEPAELVINGTAQVVYASLSYYPLFGPEGTVEHVLWVGKDTTDRVVARKAAEDARSQAERSRDTLAREFEMMKQLHNVVSMSAGVSQLNDILQSVLDASLVIAHADCGNIQLLNGETGSLEVCALSKPDGPLISPAVSLVQQGSCEHTPICGRGGALLGMLNTHHMEACKQDEIALKYMDLLASQAGRMIERLRLDSEAETESGKLGAIVGNIVDEVWLTSMDGHTTPGNRCAFEESERSRAAAETASSRVLQGETIKDQEISIVDPASSEVLYRQVSATPIRSMSGETSGAVAVIRDVTESRRLQRALQDARSEAARRAVDWEAVFEAVSEGLTILDGEGCVMKMNEAAVNIFGIDPHGKVPLRDTPSLLCHRPDGKEVPLYEKPSVLAAKGKFVRNVPIRVTNPLGCVFDTLCSTAPLRTSAGGQQRFLMTTLDVTELRHLEHLKDEFMLVIGHELRNPLQVILGLTQLLRLKVPPDSSPSLKPTIDALTSQAKILSSMVEDLLNAYRVGNGRLSIDMSRVNFRDALLEALDAQIAEPDHEWSVSVSQSDVPVTADPQRLSQIVTNLITNAKKYTPPGRRVWVNLQVDEGSAVLRVEDEGIGIPPEDLERVFEGFYRTPDATKRQAGSVGLGLYISRGLARRMGGDLWAENREGGGTVMCLTMPLAK